MFECNVSFVKTPEKLPTLVVRWFTSKSEAVHLILLHASSKLRFFENHCTFLHFFTFANLEIMYLILKLPLLTTCPTLT